MTRALGLSYGRETAVVTDFAGKTALITGAGRGIGRAVALELADAGAGVILVGRSAGQLAQTPAILLGRGTAAERVRIVPADFGEDQQRGRAVAVAVGAGRVDIQVNDAATLEPLGPTAAVPVAELRCAFELNLAAELRGTGVTVNAYRPGGVDTAMQAWIRHQDPERIGTAAHERFSQNFAEGTLITPEQSAAALIAYLGGDDTGAIWDVSTAPARS